MWRKRRSHATRCRALRHGHRCVFRHDGPYDRDRYKRAVRELADEFKRGTPTEFATIRELVTAIVVHASPSRPGGAGSKASIEDDRSVRIDIKGRLAALCGNPALFPNMAMSGVSGPR